MIRSIYSMRKGSVFVSQGVDIGDESLSFMASVLIKLDLAIGKILSYLHNFSRA